MSPTDYASLLVQVLTDAGLLDVVVSGAAVSVLICVVAFVLFQFAGSGGGE